MSVASAEFLVAVLLLSAVFFHLPSPPVRRAALTACSVGFLALFLPNVESTVALAMFLLSGYLAAIVLNDIGRALCSRHTSSCSFVRSSC